MSFGIQVDGQDLTFSALSVIAKGSLAANSSSNSAAGASITKNDYDDVTEFKVVFIATGIRDTSLEEVRPAFSETSTVITITRPAKCSAHQYLVLGR
jgi:hypothetical protein